MLEIVADISYLAGDKKYYSGDSRADINDFIWWASKFYELHMQTDWNIENYILAIEEFTKENLEVATFE